MEPDKFLFFFVQHFFTFIKRKDKGAMPELFPFILYCVYCCLNVLKIESFIETNKHTINETSSFS